MEQDAITLENIYTLLANFDKVYDKISDEEKKSLISSLIKEIEIFPCDESELPLKSILFNFPVYKDGRDVYEFLWDKSTHVSTVFPFSHEIVSTSSPLTTTGKLNVIFLMGCSYFSCSSFGYICISLINP